MSQVQKQGVDYHVHIYFDDERAPHAQRLRSHLEGDDRVTSLGRMHTGPIGPHPCRQFQVLLSEGNLNPVLNWIDENRDGLSVLIHPDIDDDWAAHTTHARWLGRPVALSLERFRKAE